MNQSDVISNIDLFRELCAQHVCTSVFALRTEDFIYKAPEMKNNLIALLTEIFIKVELEKSSINTSDNIDNIENNKNIRDNNQVEKGENSLERYSTGTSINVKENLDPNDGGQDLNTFRYEPQ